MKDEYQFRLFINDSNNNNNNNNHHHHHHHHHRNNHNNFSNNRNRNASVTAQLIYVGKKTSCVRTNIRTQYSRTHRCTRRSPLRVDARSLRILSLISVGVVCGPLSVVNVSLSFLVLLCWTPLALLTSINSTYRFVGVVWSGVVWCGMMRCGVVWCGVVWCGVVWCGVVWCGVVWCAVMWYDAVWCGVVWCGVVWCGVVWCGVGQTVVVVVVSTYEGILVFFSVIWFGALKRRFIFIFFISVIYCYYFVNTNNNIIFHNYYLFVF